MEGINNECCPEFNPVLWDEKTNLWSNKKFISSITPQFLYIPLPGSISMMMKKQIKLIERADAVTHSDEYMWLSNDISPWKSEHFIHVACDVPGAVNIELSGTFVSKVFDGPYNSVPLLKKEMDLYLNTIGFIPEKYFVFYTTCPRCAKKYGHNYIVLFARV